MAFAPFQRATPWQAPNMLEAERLKMMQEMAEQKQMREDLSSGIGLYNQFMGDETPIADALRGMMGGEEAAGDVLATATPDFGTVFASPTAEAAGAAIPELAQAGAGTIIPEAASAALPEAAAAVLPEAVAGGAAEGGLASLLGGASSMMPWALGLAAALRLFG